MDLKIVMAGKGNKKLVHATCDTCPAWPYSGFSEQDVMDHVRESPGHAVLATFEATEMVIATDTATVVTVVPRGGQPPEPEGEPIRVDGWEKGPVSVVIESFKNVCRLTRYLNGNRTGGFTFHPGDGDADDLIRKMDADGFKRTVGEPL